MRNKWLLTLVIACGAFASQTTVADEFYLAPSVIYTAADNDRLVDDGVSGAEIALGQFLSEQFAFETRLGFHGMSGADDLDLAEVGFTGLWAWQRDARVSPYLLLGGGLVKAYSDLFDDELAPFYAFGAGLNFGLGDGPMSARLEYRIRNSLEDSRDPRDDLISLGLVIPFGRNDSPAPAVPVAPVQDSDGDGVPDDRDNCANTPAGHDVDEHGCALDSDGDGVVDADDQCPATYPGASVDAKGCELDDDGDGVVNRLDRCPDTAEGARVDVNGCEIRDVIELPGVNFETNSDRLLPGADDVLRDAAATLQKYPDLVVEVAGHTDNVGAADYNQGLSERRAKTVRDYLVGAGASADNLSARGHGEASPIADNGTAEGRAANRRVELRIIEQ